MSRRRPKRLTDLELEVMHVVWDAPEPVTVRHVADGLAERAGRSGRKPAYTTVQTMLNILCRKGALRTRPGPGRAHWYEPLMSRDDAASSMTRDLVERLFGGRPQGLFAHLLEEEELPRDELERLKRAIEEQLGDDREGAR
jgi:predicted transcriptional regulator